LLAKKLGADEKIASFTQHILDFQLNFVTEAHHNKQIARYFEILRARGIDMPAPPRTGEIGDAPILPERLVLPYVYFINQNEPEYEVNKRFWAAGSALSQTEVPLSALVATNNPNLDWGALALDLKEAVKEVILWFTDVDEFTAPKNQLVGIRRGVSALAAEGFKVHLHSGGPFSMGLGPDGVTSVSAGATYGERRPAELVEGGPVPQRYFVPQLLKCFPVAETRFIIERMGIDCNHPCCQGLQSASDLIDKFFSGGPGGIETSWGPTENTKKHYMYRFKEKMFEVWQQGRSGGISVLESMLAEVSPKLPSRQWQHLANWIEAYESDFAD
jgi:hypothetical protein